MAAASDPNINLVVSVDVATRPSDEAVAQMEQEALDLMKRGDADAAMLVLAAVRDAAALPDREQLVAMTKAELAQRTVDVAEHNASLQTERRRLITGELARIDRYLAQTDWIMLPVAARPVDMSASLAATVDANQKGWTTWRAAIKTIRDQLTASLAADGDFAPAELPAQPAQPVVILT